jgi:hypothetical protein
MLISYPTDKCNAYFTDRDMTIMLSTWNCWWDGDLRQGWERQPGEGEALRARGARRNRRQKVTPEPRARRTRRADYSEPACPAGRQPVKAAPIHQ